jgi:hypothetical protein
MTIKYSAARSTWLMSRGLLGALVLLPLAGALAGADTPALVYETTVTGFNDGDGADMAVDDSGNAYVLSTDRDDDGVHLGLAVSKIGPGGEHLWVTRISGADHDGPGGIALNSAGEVWVSGWTDSADFPIVGGMDASLTGFRDAFVMRLSPSNGSITYSTYLGGDYVDMGQDIAVTSNDEIVVVGTTESTDFPTVDPLQAQLNSPPYQYADLFITRISADGSQILYSTYLGGSQDERVAAVALDGQDRIHVATNVGNDDFPLVNEIAAFSGGSQDVVVARLSADGSALEFSTYLGGGNSDQVWRIDVTPAGMIYVSGSTQSIDFPTTPGAYQEQFVGEVLGCGSPPFEPLHNCSDAFITKLDPDAGMIEYSTFLAGHNVDDVRSIAVDNWGRAHVAGYTFSNDFPGAAFGEVFITRLSADGGDADYTIAVDSVTPNAGQTVAVDGQGGVYLACSVDLPPQVYVARYQEQVAQRPGDLNCDGVIDFDDIDAFVAALAGQESYEAQYPGCDWMNADINGDGLVNFDDIDPFVALIAGGMQVLQLTFDGLEPLGADFVYEGWLIVGRDRLLRRTSWSTAPTRPTPPPSC